MIPATSLPPQSVPWGRAVVQRIEALDANLSGFGDNFSSDAQGTASALNSIAKQVESLQEASWWQWQENFWTPSLTPRGNWISDPNLPQLSFVTPSNRIRVEVYAAAYAGTNRLSFSIRDESEPDGNVFAYDRMIPIANDTAPWFSDEQFAGRQSNGFSTIVGIPKGRPVTVKVEAFVSPVNQDGASASAPGSGVTYASLIIESV